MPNDHNERKKEPFIGPNAFARNVEDQERFFGRDQETEEIITLIFSYQSILIYAQSGAGKTSILNAQVIPELEKDHIKVLPVARVGIVHSADIDISSDYNIVSSDSNVKLLSKSSTYMINALSSMKSDIDLKSLPNISLFDFLNTYFPNEFDSSGKPSPQIIIFDQMEELFTLFPESRREEQKIFFKQVADALKKKPSLRVVFVIREDYLAELDPFVSLLPESLRPRFRLERLRKEAAKLAITGPLKAENYSFDENKVNRLVDDLLRIKAETTIDRKSIDVIGEFVEPIQLQVVCQRWWRKLLSTGDDSITAGNLGDWTIDVDNALAEFYADCIREAIKGTRIKESDIRRWCESNLITSSETRSILHLDPEQTKGLPNKVIEILADRYLLKREWRAGAPWYELTHDRMIKPIKDFNAKSDKEEGKRKSRRIRFISIITAMVITAIVALILINHFYLAPPIPVAEGKALTATHINIPLRLILNGSSPDKNDKLTYYILSSPKNGRVSSLSGNISSPLKYSPDFRFTGNDSFTFKVSNGKANSTNEGIVNIIIKPIPLKPINQIVETITNKPVPISLYDVDYPELEQIRSNDTVPFRIPPRFMVGSSLYENGPFHGFVALEPSSGKAIYTPNLGYTGTDHFLYCIINATKQRHTCEDNAKIDITVRKAPEYFGYLIVSNGLTQGTVYPIHSTSVTVGRTTDQDIPDISIIDTNLDRSVSRLHTRLSYEDGKYYLQDLGSSFHTIVGHQVLAMKEKVELKNGDVFRIGSIKLTFKTNPIMDNIR